MGPVTGTVLYIVIWWVMIFAVLPWGNKAPQEVEVGHARGAPEKPRLLQKFVINTVLSAAIWCGIYYLITREIIDLSTINLIEIKR